MRELVERWRGARAELGAWREALEAGGAVEDEVWSAELELDAAEAALEAAGFDEWELVA